MFEQGDDGADGIDRRGPLEGGDRGMRHGGLVVGGRYGEMSCGVDGDGRH